MCQTLYYFIKFLHKSIASIILVMLELRDGLLKKVA